MLAPLGAPACRAPPMSPIPQFDSLACDRIVCRCLKVTESEICNAIDIQLAETVHDVIAVSQAGSGCNACHCEIKRLIAARRRVPVG